MRVKTKEKQEQRLNKKAQGIKVGNKVEVRSDLLRQEEKAYV